MVEFLLAGNVSVSISSHLLGGSLSKHQTESSSCNLLGSRQMPAADHLIPARLPILPIIRAMPCVHTPSTPPGRIHIGESCHTVDMKKQAACIFLTSIVLLTLRVLTPSAIPLLFCSWCRDGHKQIGISGSVQAQRRHGLHRRSPVLPAPKHARIPFRYQSGEIHNHIRQIMFIALFISSYILIDYVLTAFACSLRLPPRRMP